jgi:diadenosine tetraphosphate (Ap4A) HIT family hydrolase
MDEPKCHFCQKLQTLDGLPAPEVVWCFPHSVAFLGTWQYYQGYCVLVARQHATELSRLEASLRREFLDEMCLLARAIEAAYKPHKLNYELLGNQVPHLHWHLFPRYADDPDRLKPVWLVLDRCEQDTALRTRLETGRQDRATTAVVLRHHLTILGAPTA